PSLAVLTARQAGAKRRALRRFRASTRSSIATPQALAKLLQRLATDVSAAVLAHRHGALALLPLADHEHVGDLAQLGIADLARDRLAAVVELDAGPLRAQPPEHRRAVVVEAIGHRQHDRLHGCEPQRELAGVVLDQ